MFPHPMGRLWCAHRRSFGPPFMHGGNEFGMQGGGSGDGDGSFGVRSPQPAARPRVRPLARRARHGRSRAHRDEPKTKRAQVAVDERRTISGFADVLEAETLDSAKLDEARWRARALGAAEERGI